MATCKQVLSTGGTCPHKARRRGLCDGHYTRLYRMERGTESRYPMNSPVQGPGGGRWVGDDVAVKVVGSRVALAAVAIIEREAKRRKTTAYKLVGDIIENWAKKHSPVGRAA